MATFPSLAPASRTFTPGRYTHSAISSLNGLQARVRTSTGKVEQRLRLTFVALTEAEMLSIRGHYSEQEGPFISFGIPDLLLKGMNTPSSFTPAGYSWIYANSPQVEDIGIQRYTVSVELMAIPFEGANTNGREFIVDVTFAPGVATGTANASGVTFTTIVITIVDDIPFGDVTFSSPPASWPSVVASIPEFGDAVGLAGGFTPDPFNLIELGYEFDFNLSEEPNADLGL